MERSQGTTLLVIWICFVLLRILFSPLSNVVVCPKFLTTTSKSCKRKCVGVYVVYPFLRPRLMHLGCEPKCAVPKNTPKSWGRECTARPHSRWSVSSNSWCIHHTNTRILSVAPSKRIPTLLFPKQPSKFLPYVGVVMMPFIRWGADTREPGRALISTSPRGQGIGSAPPCDRVLDLLLGQARYKNN